MVNVLLFTGVRISEALNATTASYSHDAGHRTLSIQRKGGETAKVAVPAPAVEALNLYLGITGADVVPVLGPVRSRPPFTTETGSAWNRSDAFRTVQRLARKAVVEGQISPHSLRHTFATIALDNGVALHDLQDSLGQADPRTTRRYDRWHKLAKWAGLTSNRAGIKPHHPIRR